MAVRGRSCDIWVNMAKLLGLRQRVLYDRLKFSPHNNVLFEFNQHVLCGHAIRRNHCYARSQPETCIM